MLNTQFIDLENKYVVNNYHPLDLVLSRGHGIWVYDLSGKRYMDFLSAYSSLNQGHSHKKIVDAVKKQVGRLTLTSRAFRNDQLGLFSMELCKLIGFEQVILMNSGTEAVETAIKVARKWGYYKKGVEQNKAEIVVFTNNFHGRTISVVSFSAEEQYRDGFGPFTEGFKIVRYNDIAALKNAIGKNTVAVLVEPIQAEAGIIIPDHGYLEKVAKICHANKILFMLDEIQTGLGRTGKLFAYQHEQNAKPDVLILGKALGGGFYPVSAVLASREVFGLIRPGDHGSTFGGNPLACRVASAAVKVVIEENLTENSATMGEYLIKRLGTIRSEWMKEVRGKGLLIGIELTSKSGGARKFCEQLAHEGILCKETHGMVIRLAPPLIITKAQVDYAFKKIKRVLESDDL